MYLFSNEESPSSREGADCRVTGRVIIFIYRRDLRIK
jgi:hypothetical protein